MTATLQMHKQILERQEVQFLGYSGTSGPFDSDSDSVVSASSSGSGGAQMRTAVSLLAFAASMARGGVDMGGEGEGEGGGMLTRDKVASVLAAGGERGLGELLQSALGLPPKGLAPPAAAVPAPWGGGGGAGGGKALTAEEARALFAFLR